jgi:hypothetical protein
VRFPIGMFKIQPSSRSAISNDVNRRSMRARG